MKHLLLNGYGCTHKTAPLLTHKCCPSLLCKVLVPVGANPTPCEAFADFANANNTF